MGGVDRADMLSLRKPNRAMQSTWTFTGNLRQLGLTMLCLATETLAWPRRGAGWNPIPITIGRDMSEHCSVPSAQRQHFGNISLLSGPERTRPDSIANLQVAPLVNHLRPGSTQALGL